MWDAPGIVAAMVIVGTTLACGAFLLIRWALRREARASDDYSRKVLRRHR